MDKAFSDELETTTQQALAFYILLPENVRDVTAIQEDDNVT